MSFTAHVVYLSRLTNCDRDRRLLIFYLERKSQRLDRRYSKARSSFYVPGVVNEEDIDPGRDTSTRKREKIESVRLIPASRRQIAAGGARNSPSCRCFPENRKRGQMELINTNSGEQVGTGCSCLLQVEDSQEEKQKDPTFIL